MKQLFILLLLVVAACSSGMPEPTNPNPEGIQYFASEEELADYLEENQQSSSGYGMRALSASVSEMAVQEDSVASRPAGDSSGTDGAGDFSTTNIQEQGVDEADIIKNDGKYLYVLAGENLVIMDAYPAEDAKILSETNVEGRPESIFLDDDRLVVFTSVDDEEMHWPEYSILPEPRHVQATQAQIYDISSKEDPELTETIKVTGSFEEARMIGGEVYVITTQYPQFEPFPIMPRIETSSDSFTTRIGYFDNPEENYQYTTVTKFDSDGSRVEGESFLAGRSNTIYMSENALYIAYQKNTPWRQEQREQFFDVVVPVLPQDLQQEITSIRNSRIAEEMQWEQISEALEEHVSDLSEKEQERFYEDIQDAVAEHEREQVQERSKTTIHKIGLDLEHKAQGEVSGTLLNQFSMSEDAGNLRLATTTSVWTQNERIQHNNVYILDEELEITGSIEGLAEEERIYSTRFIGERLYMVTFKQIDPFFVIDLADPENPEVLGELKIPGWSDYLHPYDENHIIGIGKTTEENEWGGISAGGVKLSLFNVENVSNPIEVDNFAIGTRGSDSEVLRDHKALLFDKERELLVLPVRETQGDYRNVWQGAYVFEVTEEGFEERERIAHYTGDRENYWSWWGSTSAVRRALYMDDVLYTVSLEKVRMHDLDTLESINTVELPYEEKDYGHPRPEPMPVEPSGGAASEPAVEQIE